MRSWAWRVGATLYVGVVAALAASAFSRPDATFTWGTEGVAMLLTLPALVPALPVVYVVGAGIWALTNADNGGQMWPVTLVYALMFAAVAVANLWVLHRLVPLVEHARLRRAHRSAGHDLTATRLGR